MTKEHRLYGKPIPVKAIDTTGAGDAFAAAFVSIAAGRYLTRAIASFIKRYFANVYLRFSNAYAVILPQNTVPLHAMATTQEFHEFLQNFHISNVIISDS